nr:elongation factor Tu GTP binding [Hymenolepis microstoma]
MSVASRVLPPMSSQVDKIRNVCILAHVDHGKTTLADALLATNGIISSRQAGQVRYMDSLEAEQIRGITMKSSSVGLFFNPTIQINRQTNPETASSDPNSYLINLIDSPGHVDFASDVSTAVRLCDCALIVVDVVEGVCPQTRTVLREAWNERLTLILVLNKVDRLFVQLRLSPLQVYDKILRLLEQVNSVLAELYKADIMKQQQQNTTIEGAGGTYTWNTGLENRDDSHVYFSPDQSNVIFASAMDGWGFRISDFADLWAERMKLPKKGLLKALWGDYYFAPSPDGGPPRVKSNARSKNKNPVFVQLIIDNLYHIYNKIILEENRGAAGHIAERLGIKLEDRYLQQNHNVDNHSVLRSILSAWLPLGPAIFRSIVEICPSPSKAITPKRARFMIFGENTSTDQVTFENDVLEDDEIFPALSALQKCSSSFNDPVIIFVSKVFCSDTQTNATSTVTFPKTRKEEKIVASIPGSQVASNSSTTVPNNEFIALSRIYSGRVRLGQRLFVLGPKFDGSNVPDCLLDANPNDLPLGPLKIPDNEEEEEGEIQSSSPFRRRSISNSSLSSNASDAGSMGMGYPGHDDRFVRHAYVGEINDVVQFCGGQHNVIRLKNVKYPDDSLPAGNVVGLVGSSIVNNLPKSGLLVSSLRMVTSISSSAESKDEFKRRIQPLGGLAVWRGVPVVSLVIEPVSTTESDMLLLEEGLKLLERSDPCAEVTFTAKGECLLHAAGEIHMQKCLEDLTKYFAPELELHTSPLVVPFRETVTLGCPPSAYTPFDSLAFAKAQLERELKQKNLVHDEVRENCVRKGDAEGTAMFQLPEQESEIFDPTPFLPLGMLQLPHSKLRTRIFVRTTAHPIPENLLNWLESRGAAYVKVLIGSVKRKSASSRRAVAYLKRFEDEFASQLDAIPPESCVNLDWRSLKSRLLCLGPQQVGPNLLFSRLRSGLFRLDTAWGKPMPPWAHENDPASIPSEVRGGGSVSLMHFLSYGKAILRGFQMATERGPLCAEPLRGVAFVLEEIYAEDRMQLPIPRILTAADLQAEASEETKAAEEQKLDITTIEEDKDKSEEDDPILAKLMAKQAAIDKRQKDISSMAWLISDDEKSDGEYDGDYNYSDDEWNEDIEDVYKSKSEESEASESEEEEQVVEVEKKLTINDHFYWQRRSTNSWLSEIKPELLTSVMNRACMAAFMACPAQRLVLSMYDVELLCRSDGLGRMYAVLRKRCARIVNEDMREGEECFVIHARLPVVESFGLTDDLRKRTSGQVSLPQLRPGGWEVLDIDPLQRDASGKIAVLGETHIKIWQRQQEAIKKLKLQNTETTDLSGQNDARSSFPLSDIDSGDSQVEEELAKDEIITDLNRIRGYLRDVRKRKGLNINEQLVMEGAKQRTLTKNK